MFDTTVFKSDLHDLTDMFRCCIVLGGVLIFVIIVVVVDY